MRRIAASLPLLIRAVPIGALISAGTFYPRTADATSGLRTLRTEMVSDEISGAHARAVEDQLVIRLSPATSREGAAKLAFSLGLTAGKALTFDDDLLLVEIKDRQRLRQQLSRAGFHWNPKLSHVENAVRGLRANRWVARAEPNAVFSASAKPIVVDDPHYSEQFALDKYRMGKAWNQTMGEAHVRVAILDTGMAYQSAEQDGRQFWEAVDFATTTVVAPWDFVNDDADALDDNGHGSHVAGTIAAATDNGEGVAGMAPGVAIMPVKILDSNGDGCLADLLSGLDWAVEHGARVINMSFSFPPGFYPGQILEEKLTEVRNAGCVIVASSGNDGLPAVSFPAAYNPVIAVGSAKSKKRRASYSNYGPGLDVVAYGGTDDEPILSVGLDPNTLEPGYWWSVGTSAAAPFVSSLAALLFSQGAESPLEVESVILGSTANPGGGEDYNDEVGFGMIKPKVALQKAFVLETELRSMGQIADYDDVPRIFPNELFGAIADLEAGLLLLLEDETGLYAFVDHGCDSREFADEALYDDTFESICDIAQYVIEGYNLTEILGSDGGLFGFLSNNGGLLAFLSNNGSLFATLSNNGGLLGLLSNNGGLLAVLNGNGDSLGFLDSNGGMLAVFANNGSLLSTLNSNGPLLAEMRSNGGLLGLMSSNGGLMSSFSQNGHLNGILEVDGSGFSSLDGAGATQWFAFPE